LNAKALANSSPGLAQSWEPKQLAPFNAESVREVRVQFANAFGVDIAFLSVYPGLLPTLG
jgi:hypothetical protein